MISALLLLIVAGVSADELDADRQARLRGSVTAERAWWDVMHYDLNVEFFPDEKTIKGLNKIRFKVLQPSNRMQIDLQEPLKITSVTFGSNELDFQREENVYWINFDQPLHVNTEAEICITYEGQPTVSRHPPWSGGISWDNDEKGNPFITTTCQGIGASIWWPNKDHGYDEPDRGMNIRVTVPDELTAVSNGRLDKVDTNTSAGTKKYHWIVTQPINNYCVNVNIGNYVNFAETYKGEFGKLDLEYWVLSHQREMAEKHFKEAPRTIEAFEHWFGKYPFYEDSYKLVVVPYPGMEHQSSVTYGNGFKNGYVGRDLSDTGVGFKFDFIIVHESGHEWFGNSISMKDVADMWIHEGFTNYSENLFVEYHFSEKEAQDYVIGCRALVKNDKPIIGKYDRNQEGSGDMYYKAGNMLHTMRHILNDDDRWRAIMRGINKTFWHQIVTTQQIESYINEQSGIDFSKFFDQYLRTVNIPVLQYSIKDNELTHQFTDVVKGFSFPILVRINGEDHHLQVSDKSQRLTWKKPIEKFEIDRNFYIKTDRKN